MGRGDEQRRHFSPGFKALAAAATAAAASLSSRGFSSLSTLGGVVHRRLGESSLPAAAADAQKVYSGRASVFSRLHGMDLFFICNLYRPKRRTFIDINQCDYLPPFFFFLFFFF